MLGKIVKLGRNEMGPGELVQGRNKTRYSQTFTLILAGTGHGIWKRKGGLPYISELSMVDLSRKGQKASGLLSMSAREW